jgi:hypothetical protein
MDKRKVMELILKLKKSEEAKSACGLRLIKFYEGFAR